MKATQLLQYQSEAVDAIQKAFERKQKHIVVELPTGFGKSLIFAKTAEYLNRMKAGKILVASSSMTLKEKIEQDLSTNYQGFIQVDKDCIVVDTVQKILKQQIENTTAYQVIILYEATLPKELHESLVSNGTTIISFFAINSTIFHRPFASEDVVFSYSYKDAVNDGYLTPAMDTMALEPAVEAFSKQLLEQFGYHQIASCIQDQDWDLIVSNGEHKIWVEYKTYKSQVVSPSTADSLLKTILMRKRRQEIPREDLVLLVILSRIPSFQKDEIFKRYKIIVWDIENLVFYSKSSPSLLKQLSQITYFPINYIEGQRSGESALAGLSFASTENEIVHEVETETAKTSELIRQLQDCPPGQDFSGDYEKICEKILRTLFEATYFNRLTAQHRTEDEHFRMDLIGSLKINQSNEESMHPLWKMLVQHYNSHFVVFEFKNYTKEIDQNLIYITEKYLFDAALRNVAFIISRKGFSESAKFAAEGCLKEHGKLILDVTEKDLVQMLEAKSDEAADHLLTKLEEFLMGISK